MIKWKRRLINFPQLVQRSEVFDQKLDVPTLLSVFSYPSNDVQRSEVFNQKLDVPTPLSDPTQVFSGIYGG